MAAYGRRIGLDVNACEYSPVGRLLARAQGVRSMPFDVRTDTARMLGPEADIAYCTEVAEHLTAELGDRLVAFLGEVAPLVLFTAAYPGQGGQGHINEQSREYWIDRFEKHGMAYLPDHSHRLQEALSEHLRHGRWISKNVMMFGRDAR